jgi:apolipoprotein N-acyltransferase
LNAEADLQRHGRWVGPTVGFLFCLAGGWWVARRLKSDQEWNGLAVGLLAAVLDVALLVYAGAPFAWVFVLSTAGRIAAGYLGGDIARRRARQEPQGVLSHSVSH